MGAGRRGAGGLGAGRQGKKSKSRAAVVWATLPGRPGLTTPMLDHHWPVFILLLDPFATSPGARPTGPPLPNAETTPTRAGKIRDRGQGWAGKKQRSRR